MNIYEKAISFYGFSNQSLQLQEECAELIVALSHSRRGMVFDDSIIEELADVEILIEQLKLCFGKNKFDAIKAMKLKRLEQRIDMETEHEQDLHRYRQRGFGEHWHNRIQRDNI